MDRALSGSGAAVQTDEEIELASFPFEFMMNALRFNDGFALSLFADRTGLAVERILLGLARAEKAGLIERDHERVQPTLRGRRFLNDLLQIFLP
jgi:oxygen-independent coproporphyrinogen-3 oxidase